MSTPSGQILKKKKKKKNLTDPKEKCEFCFPIPFMLSLRGNKIHCFGLDQSLSVLL